MTDERKYEEWFEKYLGDIESPYSSDLENSPFMNIPKRLNTTVLMSVCVCAAIAVVALSCLLAFLHFRSGQWFIGWASNALLNLSIGIIASIILMFYSNLRERNVAFYSDVIPLLEKKYKNMYTAYHQYIFKFPRYYSEGDYTNCYDAWHYCSNTSFVIIDFLTYLNTVLPFRPRCFGFSEEDLKTASSKILEANHSIQDEFFNASTISKKTFDTCQDSLFSTDRALWAINALILELKRNLYGIKYGTINKKAIKILDEQ